MIDAATLFVANGIVLLVLVGVMATAWVREPGALYWSDWFWDKLLLIGSMVCFALDSKGGTPWLAALSNMLMVAGLGFRWRAARHFNGRPISWTGSIFGPVALAATGALSPHLLPFGIVFVLTNILLSAQLVATAWEFWSDNEDGLGSRLRPCARQCPHGPGLRRTRAAGPGSGLPVLIGPDPRRHDGSRPAWGLVYTVSRGAFSLSLAFERSLSSLQKAAFSALLTGLPNRRAFEQRFAKLAGAARPVQAVALAMVDIDHFKSINDRYGHAAGDIALQTCARTIMGFATPSVYPARTGGEEFAILMTGVSSEHATALAQEIRSAVARTPVVIEHRLVPLTVSIGLHHMASGGSMDLDGAMHQADTSLYAAKAAGRNRIVRAASA